MGPQCASERRCCSGRWAAEGESSLGSFSSLSQHRAPTLWLGKHEWGPALLSRTSPKIKPPASGWHWPEWSRHLLTHSWTRVLTTGGGEQEKKCWIPAPPGKQSLQLGVQRRAQCSCLYQAEQRVHLTEGRGNGSWFKYYVVVIFPSFSINVFSFSICS